MTHSIAKKKTVAPAAGRPSGWVAGIGDLLAAARGASAHTTNTLLLEMNGVWARW